jgi:hypothetical protein
VTPLVNQRQSCHHRKGSVFSRGALQSCWLACEEKIMPETATAWMYTRLIVLLLALTAGGLMFYRMVEHMETMTVLMASMSDSMATMSADISAMRVSIEQLDRTVGKGAREMQQLNPLQMMVPGGRQ